MSCVVVEVKLVVTEVSCTSEVLKVERLVVVVVLVWLGDGLDPCVSAVRVTEVRLVPCMS